MATEKPRVGPKDYMRDVPNYLGGIKSIEKAKSGLHGELTEEVENVDKARKDLAAQNELPNVIDVLIQRAREKELNQKLENIRDSIGIGDIYKALMQAEELVYRLKDNATEIERFEVGDKKFKEVKQKNTLERLAKREEKYVKPEDYKIKPEEINDPEDPTIKKAAEFLLTYLKEKNLRPEDSPKSFMNGVISDIGSGLFLRSGIPMPDFLKRINWNATSIDRLKKFWNLVYENDIAKK